MRLGLDLGVSSFIKVSVCWIWESDGAGGALDGYEMGIRYSFLLEVCLLKFSGISSFSGIDRAHAVSLD
jgi:hypothetical protein